MEVALFLCCCSRECGRGHWGEQCSAEAGARCDQQPQESPGQHYRGEAQCDQRPLEQAAGAAYDDHRPLKSPEQQCWRGLQCHQCQ